MYKLAVDYLRRPDADLEAGQRQASDASLRSATNIARGAHTRHAWEKPKCVKAMAEFTQDNLHWPLVKPLLPTQPSSCLDEEVVDRYASELRRLDGSRRRPTVLLYRGYGGSLLILDGHHKLAACQRVRSTLANPCLNFLILTPLSDGDREHAPRQEVDATYPTTSRANDLTSFSDRMARLHSAWVPFAWQVHRDRCVCSVRRGALAHGRCVCSDCLEIEDILEERDGQCLVLWRKYGVEDATWMEAETARRRLARQRQREREAEEEGEMSREEEEIWWEQDPAAIQLQASMQFFGVAR